MSRLTERSLAVPVIDHMMVSMQVRGRGLGPTVGSYSALPPRAVIQDIWTCVYSAIDDRKRSHNQAQPALARGVTTRMADPEPVAELDARFSAPEASATPWADVRRVIQETELFWIATVRGNGRAQRHPAGYRVARRGALLLYRCRRAEAGQPNEESEVYGDDREQRVESGP